MILRTTSLTLLAILLGLASHSQAGNPGSLKLSDTLVLAVGKQIGIEGETFTEEQLANVTELEIDHADRFDLRELAHFPQLQKLVLRGNFISDLAPLSTLVHLTYLNLSDNRISDLTPLKSLTALTYLNLSNNLIVDCSPLAGLSKLRSIRLSSNAIESLASLARLPRLGSLHAGENRLASLKGIEPLTTLTDLRVNQNSIVDLEPVSALIALTVLSADQNRIENLMPLNRLRKLRSLSIRQNPINSIAPLTGLSRLEQLSIESTLFDGELSPLSRITNLVELTLTQSNVRNIEPLTSLNKLSKLDLRNNNIVSVRPLIESRAPFETINLTGNPLGTLARAVVIPALRQKAQVAISGGLFNSPSRLYDGFMDIDQNRDRSLSYDEARTSVAGLDLVEFDALDANGDWAISMNELAEFNVVLAKSMDRVWVGGGESRNVRGTKDSPFDTLDKAIKAVKRGGTIILKPGASLTGGTLSEPIIITVPTGSKIPGRIGGAKIQREAPTVKKKNDGS